MVCSTSRGEHPGELTICLEKKTDKLDRLGGIGSRESNGFVWKIWVGQNG